MNEKTATTRNLLSQLILNKHIKVILNNMSTHQ